MIVNVFKTKKVVAGDNLYKILDVSLPKLKEKDVVIITSKIVSICSGRAIKKDGKLTKEDIIKKEADLIMPKRFVRFGVILTIKNSILVGSAGVDESNGNDYFILWPQNPNKSATEIWSYLRKKHKVKHLGIIISDSHSSLFRRGAIGFGIGWCGFKPLRDYVGKKDIFGRVMRVEKTNVVDGLAVAAVVNMGEGNEQTPIALIRDAKGIEFVNRVPNKEEINQTTISLKDDVYSGPFSLVKWIKRAS